MLGYFCNINVLGFILYSVVLCNYSQFHSDLFSFTCGFFLQGFPRKFVFLFVFAFHYCAIDVYGMFRYTFLPTEFT